MLRGGWRHHLITKAASAAARYVLHDGRPSCGYVGNDLHFSFAFKTEEAAHSWKCTARPRRPRPLGQSDAITMRLSSRPRADVEIGALVDPEDYDQTDTRSPDDAWGSFCSDARSVRWVHMICCACFLRVVIVVFAGPGTHCAHYECGGRGIAIPVPAGEHYVGSTGAPD